MTFRRTRAQHSGRIISTDTGIVYPIGSKHHWSAEIDMRVLDVQYCHAISTYM